MIDMVRLLSFFQELYAHALTLQELVSSKAALRYEDVRSKYDRQAEEQFALLYRAAEDPRAFEKAARDFLSKHPRPTRPQ